MRPPNILIPAGVDARANSKPVGSRLIGRSHRTWQIVQPRHDLPVIRGQPPLEHLTGVTIQGTVRLLIVWCIQTNTRTLNLSTRRLSHLWLYRPATTIPVGNPRFIMPTEDPSPEVTSQSDSPRIW